MRIKMTKSKHTGQLGTRKLEIVFADVANRGRSMQSGTSYHAPYGLVRERGAIAESIPHTPQYPTVKILLYRITVRNHVTVLERTGFMIQITILWAARGGE